MDSLPRQQGDRVTTLYPIALQAAIEELVERILEDVDYWFEVSDIDRNQAEILAACLIRRLSWSSDLRNDLSTLICDLPSD
ncbi:MULTISPECIES: hypothetical protein [Cyanophyceae]|uniref:hypothetical protein n=1 Tax=Cyanophyceae TaxID=3028117 RepID=UPI001682373C|nr:hypothetical protein [Trichocoleus sp. FACHB-40]MBD2006325.1 hypothetical protein [Trichocoleus sp. FACHB-40]